MPGSDSEEIESITVTLAGLEITISARAVQSSSGGDTARVVVESSSAAGSTPGVQSDSLVFHDPYSLPEDLKDQALRAVTTSALESLPLPFLTYLLPQLRAASTGWSPKARLARAFRAGVIARKRIEGQYLDEVSLGLPLRNQIYICLRGRFREPPFWTSSYGIYLDKVGSDLRDQTFQCDSVSHAFPSRAEVQAYLVGAQTQWPPEASRDASTGHR